MPSGDAGAPTSFRYVGTSTGIPSACRVERYRSDSPRFPLCPWTKTNHVLPVFAAGTYHAGKFPSASCTVTFCRSRPNAVCGSPVYAYVSTRTDVPGASEPLTAVKGRTTLPPSRWVMSPIWPYPPFHSRPYRPRSSASPVAGSRTRSEPRSVAVSGRCTEWSTATATPAKYQAMPRAARSTRTTRAPTTPTTTRGHRRRPLPCSIRPR